MNELEKSKGEMKPLWKDYFWQAREMVPVLLNAPTYLPFDVVSSWSWCPLIENDPNQSWVNISRNTVYWKILGHLLTNSWKRKDAKVKGEKERYTYLNVEFQRIPRIGKKAFLSDQCKEIEENNRMGKTRDLFKKIRNISCKDGHNKGQKWYGPNRSRRYYEEMARINRRTIQKRYSWPR